MVRQIVIDTEVTGESTITGRHRLVEVALVEIINGEITGKSFQTYLNPEGRKNTPKALRLHNLKNSFLLGKPIFKAQLPCNGLMKL